MKTIIQCLLGLCVLNCGCKTQHSVYNIILDLDAKAMFGNKQLTAVEVKVLKKRDKGNRFIQNLVIDEKYLAANGNEAVMTRVRGAVWNPEQFERQIQWRFKDGDVVQVVPVSQHGDWRGMVLSAPVEPRQIEFEASREQLEKMGIRRITLQVRYKKFNQEFEENLNVSVMPEQELVTKTILKDKDTKGYVYRLIFDDVTEGNLISTWSAKTNDYYVFAAIPPDLKDQTSSVFQAAKKLGEVMQTNTRDGKVPDAEKILQNFQTIFDLDKK